MPLPFNSIRDSYKLANGVMIPCVGFGTWQSADGDEAFNAVLTALKEGYRHIDTAAAYGNEESVGKAIRVFLAENPEVKREDLFITTKLWNEDHGYDATEKAIETSLNRLGLDYIDLYLIHWPNPLKFRDNWAKMNSESWFAMEEAYDEGKLSSIGISNFCERHIDALLETAHITPMVNQIKLCPGQTQKELVEYSKKLGMVVEAYSPLGTGGIFNNEFMKKLSDKYERSIAQICIRWSLQMGYLPLPKSVTADRIRENAKIFAFDISPEDCEEISNLRGLDIKKASNPDEAPF